MNARGKSRILIFEKNFHSICEMYFIITKNHAIFICVFDEDLKSITCFWLYNWKQLIRTIYMIWRWVDQKISKRWFCWINIRLWIKMFIEMSKRIILTWYSTTIVIKKYTFIEILDEGSFSFLQYYIFISRIVP